MNKNLSTRVFALLLCMVMVLGMIPATVLAADNAHSAHSSYVTHIEAAEGNCSIPGNIEFWYCDYYTCRKYYSDAAMTQEIAASDAIITPGVHSEACGDCGHTVREETFSLFTISEHPVYHEEQYERNGLHSLTPYLSGCVFLFVSEDENGNLYAMGNETNEDGSRQAVNITDKVNADGTVTVDSDTVEFFTYLEIDESYTFSSDNGYMSVMDEKIVVRTEAVHNFYETFFRPQAIRFEQDPTMDDYAADKGYLFAWDFDSGMISFDPSEPAFVPSKSSSGNYSHSIMLYMQSCEHLHTTHTEEVELTCTQDGNMEYWYCEDCHLYFSNEECTEYIKLPEDEDNYEDYLYTRSWGHYYDENCICENCGEKCPHTDAIYTEVEHIDASCFEPGMDSFWFCEECWSYLDKNQENAFWEDRDAAKLPAFGHAFNADTGVCDHCGIPNPVYSKVTSLADVNEEDLYIIVAEANGRHFALGGLYEPDEGGYLQCGADLGNAISVTPNADGTISLLNQNTIVGVGPSEFMFDINPELFNSGLSEFGLTTVMPKLPNYCVYPFQSYSYDNTGYMGVPRYANGEYGQWDSSDWIIDFYTTTVDENTYHDGVFSDEEGQTHAQQLEDGNIGENVAEGNLLLYTSSFVSAGGAMFTLRLREYPNPDTGVTEYYFICGEDWALEGSDGWDYVTDTTPTNDTQYAIWLYRCDVPAADTHKCDWSDWVDDENGKTHTRTCQDSECGKSETESHVYEGIRGEDPTCTEDGFAEFGCIDCDSTYKDTIPSTGHTYEGIRGEDPTCTEDGFAEFGCIDCDDTYRETIPSTGHDYKPVVTEPSCEQQGYTTYTCVNCKDEYKDDYRDALDHTWGEWVVNKLDEANTHIRFCVCNESQSAPHNFDDGVVTVPATHTSKGVKTFTCADCKYTYDEEIPETTEHTWTDWSDNQDGTHTRSCRCNANETEDCTYDNGVETEPATHTEKGVKTYTCTVCGHTYTEDIPVLQDHSWGEWVVNKLDEANTHIRFCVCNETQTAPHNFDDGVVTVPATHTSKGVKTFTCADCKYTYDEEIPETTEHTWTDWSDNQDGTHTRSCRCNANETFAHTWSDWAEHAAGGYRRSCDDCGAFETMILDEEKPVNTTTSNNAASTNLTNTDIELIETVLTNEEQSQVAQGAEVKVYLKVEDISNEAPATHKAEVETTAGDDEIGMYLDIDLFKQIGDANETQVTETNGKVTITITIPENLINTDNSITRTYKIIRVHEVAEGILMTDVIEGIFNPEDNTFTFETDKFSTYALSYADEELDPIAKIGDTKYQSVAEALDAAKAGETVTVTANSTEEGLVVKAGVTLDLGNYTVTSDYLIALNGSIITGATMEDATSGAKLIVPQGSVAVTDGQAAAGASGWSIVPVYTDGVYTFARAMIHNPTFLKNAEAGTAKISFVPTFNKYMKQNIFNDGCEDNDVAIIIRVSYMEGDIKVTREYYYTTPMVKASMLNNQSMFAEMTGCNSLTDLEFTIAIVTNCGVTVESQTYTY